MIIGIEGFFGFSGFLGFYGFLGFFSDFWNFSKIFGIFGIFLGFWDFSKIFGIFLGFLGFLGFLLDFFAKCTGFFLVIYPSVYQLNSANFVDIYIVLLLFLIKKQDDTVHQKSSINSILPFFKDYIQSKCCSIPPLQYALSQHR